MSKAAGAPTGAATADAITDSQAETVKRLVLYQSYVGMRQALDLLTEDGWPYRIIDRRAEEDELAKM